jgi:hypothetical protein
VMAMRRNIVPAASPRVQALEEGPFVCARCGDSQPYRFGMLPWHWARLEIFYWHGERRRVHLCSKCARRYIPAELQRSSPVVANKLVCGPCGARTDRISLDRELPFGWMRFQIGIDGQFISGGGEQGQRMYFCPSCGPEKLPPLLEAATGRKET